MLAASRFDLRFLGWAALWSVASLLAFGVASAILPNPIFGRQIPADPFAIARWLTSAPLMGLVAATYTAPAAPPAVASLASTTVAPNDSQDGSVFGSVAGIGTFLAIGCPVCNKVALALLGTSGAGRDVGLAPPPAGTRRGLRHLIPPTPVLRSVIFLAAAFDAA